MLFDNKGRFYNYRIINKIIKKLNTEEVYYYSKPKGDLKFKESILKWIFKNDDSIYENYYFDIYPTSGATGAISNTISNFVDKYNSVLVSNHYWSTYKNITNDNLIYIKNYNFFDNEFKFDIESFKQSIYEIINKENKLFLLINDPCNNPTGYSLSLYEWKEIIKLLNEISLNHQVTLLIDLAYFDYYLYKNENLKYIFKNLNNTLIFLAVSCSKSFSIYGFRVGALLCFSKNVDDILNFSEKMNYTIKSRYGSINTMGINVTTNLFCNKKYQKRYYKELNKINEMLNKRAKLITQKLNQYNIKHIKYSGGFFISIFDKEESIFENLKEHKVYIVKNQDVLRIAISSVRLSEINRLIDTLNKCINGND